MTITTKEIREKQIELQPPMFWHDKRRGEIATEMIGLIDEKTMVRIFMTDDYTNVTNIIPQGNDLQEAYNKWQPITEEEFFAALATAVERVSLTPVLTEKI